jgi:hypothetical protein
MIHCQNLLLIFVASPIPPKDGRDFTSILIIKGVQGALNSDQLGLSRLVKRDVLRVGVFDWP